MKSGKGFKSPATKPGETSRGPSLVDLLRTASNEIQLTELASNTAETDRTGSVANILDYIESSWGLGLSLFPAQRFIVKLYYHLPLEDKVKTIRLSDMFNRKILYEFTEAEYLEYLYNEGRCNIKEQDHERRELILAVGRRSGKCLSTANTLVLTNSGVFRFQDLGNSLGPEWQPLKLDVAQEGSIRNTSSHYYNGGVQDTIKVKSHYGIEVEGTPNHRVKVMGLDGMIQWRALENIQVGDQLCVHRKTDLWATDTVNLRPYHGTTPPGNANQVKLPGVLDETWATFLGVLVGDGTWTTTRAAEVTVGPYPEWLDQVKSLFRETVGEPCVHSSLTRAHRVSYYSVALRAFLNRIGFRLDVESHTKTIPWVILRSPKPVVMAFLRGLFETDGCVETHRSTVSFSTASKELAREVQALLLNLGILSRVKARLNKKYQRYYYHLNVVGSESVRVFAKEVGFLSQRKQAKLEAHLALGVLGNKSRTEAIPNQRDWCRRLVASVPNGINQGTGYQRMLLRNALGNILKTSNEQLSYPRLIKALPLAVSLGADPVLVQHFQDILDTGYAFDPVVSVTPGRTHVSDLTVPEGESFVANGLTNHNTALSGIFASYELYKLLHLGNPQSYYGLPPGNRIQLISIGTDKDQAGILFNEVTSHLNRCDYFTPFIANNTQSLIQFRTPADIERFGTSVRQDGKFVSFAGKATIRVTFKSCIAKGLRGFGNLVIILDEMAHFQDKGQSSAEDIYNAVQPSATAFSPKDPQNPQQPIGDVESRIICISSPLNRTGKFYDLFQQAMSNGPGSTNLLAIQAPTWEINPTVPTSYYIQKYHSDPAVFMTEHGAQFSDRVRGWIEREVDLVACVDPDLGPVEQGIPRYPYYMGVDLGLVNDGTSVVIVHVDGEQIVLDYYETWRAGESWTTTNPHLGNRHSTEYARTLQDEPRLDFDRIGEWIRSLAQRFYIAEGIFDRWSGIPLEQYLWRQGLKQFTSEYFTRDLSSKIYQTAKMLILDRKVRLWERPKPELNKHTGLVGELLILQAEMMSKNLVVVQAPQKSGYHDDLSDAFVRAVWLAQSHYKTNRMPVRANPSTVQGSQLQFLRQRRLAHGVFNDRPSVRRR